MNSVKAACAAGLLGLGLVAMSTPASANIFHFGGGGHHKGGHGGGSGGAPSPEVNVALGLALAGGTVAFLRRRKNASKSGA